MSAKSRLGKTYLQLWVHMNGRKVRCRQYDKCPLLRIVSLNGVPLHLKKPTILPLPCTIPHTVYHWPLNFTPGWPQRLNAVCKYRSLRLPCYDTVLLVCIYRPIQTQVFLLYTPQTVILSASTAVRSRGVRRCTDSVEGFCHLAPLFHTWWTRVLFSMV